MIRTALVKNYDLRDAVLRVEEARANLGITRSNQYPNVGAAGALDFTRLSRDGATPLPPALLPNQNRILGNGSLELLSFEIDIWGKLRRATEAARANLLGEEENRKAVVTTLVSDVATAYLTMRELDYELEISRRTLQAREESLALTKSRQKGGVSTLLDLRQAEQLVDTAAETIPSLRTADRTDGKSDYVIARREPRKHSARTQSHRAGLAPRGARPASPRRCSNGGPTYGPRNRR